MRSLPCHLLPALLYALSTNVAADDGNALLGCWLTDRIDLYVEGRPDPINAPSDCVLYFTPSMIYTRCHLNGRLIDIDYVYALSRTSAYTARIVKNDGRPDLLGATNTYFFDIKGDQLSITAFPQSAVPARQTTTDMSHSTSTLAAGLSQSECLDLFIR